MERQWKDKIATVGADNFESAALEIFHFQYEQNAVYRSFVDAIRVQPQAVKSLRQVPFLPIRFFKSHDVQTTDFLPQQIFESSGTTGTVNSRHLVKDSALYESSFIKGFEEEYGPLNQWCILGLLPSYLERNNSSLVYMVNEMITRSGHAASGFYLDEFADLAEVLRRNEAQQQPTLLIGVTFALLDFAAAFPQKLEHTIIMETGGMKGRRREMIRDEVHDLLTKAFGQRHIHSEYGMTELLSQAYSTGDGIYTCPPWMRIFLRDEADPLELLPSSTDPIRGVINVVDLANVYSCSFIATDDAGLLLPDNRFSVLGRVDGSDVRGCSLLYI